MANETEDAQKKPGLLKRIGSLFRRSNSSEPENFEISEPSGFEHVNAQGSGASKQDSAEQLENGFVIIGEVDHHGYGHIEQYGQVPEASSSKSSGSRSSEYSSGSELPNSKSQYGKSPLADDIYVDFSEMFVKPSEDSVKPLDKVNSPPTNQYGQVPPLSKQNGSQQNGPPPPVPPRNYPHSGKNTPNSVPKQGTIAERKNQLNQNGGIPLGGLKPNAGMAPGHGQGSGKGGGRG